MFKQQIAVAVLAVIAVLFLYTLPKGVVENERSSAVQSGNSTPQAGDNTGPEHHPSINPLDSQRISLFKQKIINEDSVKSAIFADSIAELYLNYGQLDSAVRYAVLLAELTPGAETWEKTGDYCYEAYKFAVTPESAQQYGEEVRKYYGKVVAQDSSKVDLEARMAMTYVSTENPMQGVLALRRLAEEYPENIEAQFNLGLLSIQSGQYERAVGRFERVRELDEQQMEATFYLGVSHLELGNKDLAETYLKEVKAKEGNSTLGTEADRYLKQME